GRSPGPRPAAGVPRAAEPRARRLAQPARWRGRRRRPALLDLPCGVELYVVPHRVRRAAGDRVVAGGPSGWSLRRVATRLARPPAHRLGCGARPAARDGARLVARAGTRAPGSGPYA